MPLLNETMFFDLAQKFSQILNERFQYSLYKGTTEWNLWYKAKSGTGLRLKLYEVGCYESFDVPIIKIIRLNVVPPGRGLGTLMVKSFMTQFAATPFTRVLVMGANQAAVAFWQKVGFTKQNADGDDRNMCMDIIKYNGIN